MKFFVTILEPYNSVDTFIWERFKQFPRIPVPDKYEQPSEYLDFLDDMEELINIAELREVDVVIHNQGDLNSQIIHNINDFEFFIREYLDEEKILTPGLPQPGIWSVESVDYRNDFWDVVDAVANPWYDDYKFELPDSYSDTEDDIGTKDSDINVLGRLAKFGQTTPFLNENGIMSDEAKQELEDLILSEATDAEVLDFLKFGIDKVSDVAGKAKDVVKDGAKGGANLAKKGLEKVKEIEKEAKEKIEKSNNQKKEIEKLKVDMEETVSLLNDVDIKRAAKDKLKGDDESKELTNKKEAESAASNVIKRAVELGAKHNTVDKAKLRMQTAFKAEYEKIKEEAEKKEAKE